MAKVNADLNIYDIIETPEALQAGWYEAKVIDSEINEGPNGPYIQWTWEIIGEPNRVWDYMSLNNEVSMKRLKTMAKFCGHTNPSYIADTEELHGKNCRIKLKVVVDESGEYEPKNKIAGFKQLAGDTEPSRSSEKQMKLWD